MTHIGTTTKELVQTVDCLICIGRSRVLLIRRAKEPFIGKLVMPGGHVEEGETLKQACCREVYEELGLEVRQNQLSFLVELGEGDPRPFHSSSMVFVLHLSEAPVVSPNPNEASEALCLEIASICPEELGFSHYKAILALSKNPHPTK